MLKSSLCDYSNAYILVTGTISLAAAAGNDADNKNLKVVFKNVLQKHQDVYGNIKDMNHLW